MTTKTYTVALTVDESFTPYTIGLMISDAMALMPSEPFDYSFDPYWDGVPEVVLPLVYEAPGLKATEVGTLTITSPDAKACWIDGKKFLTEEEFVSHLKTHVVVGHEVKA
jgi:hypothetical protein